MSLLVLKVLAFELESKEIGLIFMKKGLILRLESSLNE